MSLVLGFAKFKLGVRGYLLSLPCACSAPNKMTASPVTVYTSPRHRPAAGVCQKNNANSESPWGLTQQLHVPCYKAKIDEELCL